MFRKGLFFIVLVLFAACQEEIHDLQDTIQWKAQINFQGNNQVYVSDAIFTSNQMEIFDSLTQSNRVLISSEITNCNDANQCELMTLFINTPSSKIDTLQLALSKNHLGFTPTRQPYFDFYLKDKSGYIWTVDKFSSNNYLEVLNTYTTEHKNHGRVLTINYLAKLDLVHQTSMQTSTLNGEFTTFIKIKEPS